MRNLLEFLLLHLVQHPDAIEVLEEELEDHTEFTLRVHPEDVGRIIGRQGRTIQAIRTLAKVRAIQDDIRVRINVDDSVGETPSSTAVGDEQEIHELSESSTEVSSDLDSMNTGDDSSEIQAK